MKTEEIKQLEKTLIKTASEKENLLEKIIIEMATHEDWVKYTTLCKAELQLCNKITFRLGRVIEQIHTRKA